MSENITASEVKKLIESARVVIGTEESIDALKKGTAEKVIVSSNCPDDVKADIDRYASLSSTEVLAVSFTNEELGVICKKPFSISVLTIAGA